MHLPSLFVALVYVSGYMFLVFSAVCLACGLYYFVELAEEYSAATRRLIRAACYAQLAAHAALWGYERFPLLPCAAGAAAHAAYLGLLRSFPAVDLLSPRAAAAAVLLVADNVLWLRFFRADVELFYSYRVAPGPAVAAFFLLQVWLVPLAFFLSLTINDAVLPNANPRAHQMHNSSAAQTQAQSQSPRGKKSRNLVAALLEGFSAKVRYSLASLIGGGGGQSGGGGDILSSVSRRNY